MTRKIKRSQDVEVTLLIKKDDFIRPPQDAQRNALLNQALKEFTDDLAALDQHASEFVEGDLQYHLSDRTQSELSDEDIMEDWQIPIMQAMADVVTEAKGEILEIGFGRGIASSMIQAPKVASHTIIECNDSVVERFHKWKEDFVGEDIRLVHGLWQDTMPDLGLFDGVFFHTYPLNDEEYMDYVNGSVTFAEHFFSIAAEHLRPGGVFTYMTNEIDSLSRAHQRLIFKHFSSFALQKVQLELPPDVKDTWWAKSMVVIKAIK